MTAPGHPGNDADCYKFQISDRFAKTKCHDVVCDTIRDIHSCCKDTDRGYPSRCRPPREREKDKGVK